MKCPDCNVDAVLRKNSSFLYQGVNHGPIFICRNWPKCSARVSAHRKTLKPMGKLAGKELRLARRAAHAAFDPLWNDGGKMSRNKAYQWLSSEMGLSKGKCHIGQFTVKQCEQVIKLVPEKLRRL